jgi:hypothetical protein
MPIQRELTSIIHIDDELWLFPANLSAIIRMPFNGRGKNREQVFGRAEERKQIEVRGVQERGDWRGMFVTPSQYMIWDSSMMQILALRKSDFEPVRNQFVPIDLIKPPRDKGGRWADRS